MKVEILIYAYLAVCAAMIIFNIVCIFVFRKKDKNIEKRSIDLQIVSRNNLVRIRLQKNIRSSTVRN